MDASLELFVTLPTRVRICYQTFGDPSDPAVVLIMGATCSMLDWREDLLPFFSPDGDRHFLVRFDHRDTGLSTEFPVPGGYTLEHMAGDIEGLVDHLGLGPKGFHVVGTSMGGPLAYMLATRRPQQVKTVTLMFTSPGVSEDFPAGRGVDMGTLPMVPGAGDQKENYIEYSTNLYKLLATEPPSEEERKENEDLIKRIVDRDLKGGTLYSKGLNHRAALWGNWPGEETVRQVKCPATVIQGGKDQFFGPEHGEALARWIEGAEYVLWDDVGHEMPKRIWGRMGEVFLRTWKRGE
ncbi:Alpha/Beta hydrolase protein [Dactylonectria estremocensis]|uniref:Alpha/Beta hydrolase protein n=1 Tax=Dactylonectria estremocensis TaxID=1079267 RepID=A0A9P9EN71_9HYPO|nr:Alpha/Beta hydrolase protein [Dactylonectria estremocensis]